MKKALIVVDLGFGDSGKGTVVDALVRRHAAGAVVRFNGGAQAGHNVVDSVTGQHHCFAQFGAGTFVPGCKTFLAYPFLVNPLAMFHEEQFLRNKGITNAFNRMSVDERCLVTTPYHRAMNRLRELARQQHTGKRHGSCGMGIGETVAYAMAAGTQALYVHDLLHPEIATHKLETLRTVFQGCAAHLRLSADNDIVNKELSTLDYPVAELMERYTAWTRQVEVLDPLAVARFLGAQDTLIFEGAQGVLLDEDFGFQPHTTWSKTTALNANRVLDDAECRHERTVIGVLRAYATRHGAGPFPLYDDVLTREMPDKYNPENPWQARLRCGWWDFDMLRYSARVAKAHGGLDVLALTCLDQVANFSEFFWSDGLGVRFPEDCTTVPTPNEQRALTDALNSVKNRRCFSRKRPDAGVIALFEKQLALRVALYSEGRTSTEKSFVTSVLA